MSPTFTGPINAGVFVMAAPGAGLTVTDVQPLSVNALRENVAVLGR